MTSLCPGPIFSSTGFNQTYTPVGLRATSAEIKKTYERYVLFFIWSNGLSKVLKLYVN